MKYVQSSKMANLHIYFLNMDISLIISVTCLKLSTHDTKTLLGEAGPGQNNSLGEHTASSVLPVVLLKQMINPA